MKGILLFFITLALFLIAFQVTAIREAVAPGRSAVEERVISLIEEAGNADNN